MHKLSGHKSWVKNIEYSRRDNLIVTSGLDGSIYTWDINGGDCGTDESRYQKVFHTPGLMRCRISNDETKMVICTTGGYLIIVNDLNLNTLAADLKGFRPNIHRLMQLGDQYFPIVSEFKHVFDSRRRRNRIELISDFPQNNEAEVISSLAIHPHNWVALSRNTNSDEQSEWTCVHDIQEMVDPYQHQMQGSRGQQSTSSSSAFVDQEDEYDAVKMRISEDFAELRQQVLNHVENTRDTSGANRARAYLKKVNRFLTLLGCPTETTATTSTSNNSSLPLVPNTSYDMWSGQVTENRLNSVVVRVRSGLITGRVLEDLDDPEMTSGDAIYLSSDEDEDGNDETEEDEMNESQDRESDSNVEDTPRTVPRPASVHVPPPEKFYAYVGDKLSKLVEELRAMQRHMNNKYKTNKPRLLYYAQDSNAGKGFIKELCFSSDGRIIASPYANGVRIMAFNSKCQELSDCVESWHEPQKPRALTQVVANKNCHSNLVVCSKFSPNYPLLVTGCLQGTIVWHYPQF